MKRILLLVATAFVMAMVIAGPAHANSIGNFGNSNGFSNSDSVVLIGNNGFFTTGFGEDFGDGFGEDFGDGFDIDFDDGVDIDFG